PGAGPTNDAGADSPSASGDGGPCVDLASDPHNCGQCGHDCGGGSCANGACQPFEFGPLTDAPVIALVTDATRVSGLTSPADAELGSLSACPKSGCVGAPESIFSRVQGGNLGSDGVTAYASLLYGGARVVKLETSGVTD